MLRVDFGSKIKKKFVKKFSIIDYVLKASSVNPKRRPMRMNMTI